MIKTVRAALLAACLLPLLAACNTVQGVGKDVKAAGRAIEKAGEDGAKKH